MPQSANLNGRNPWRYMNEQSKAMEKHIAGLMDIAQVLLLHPNNAAAMRELAEIDDEITQWRRHIADLPVEMARVRQQTTQQKAG